jgi:hypothetical protein
MTDIKDQLERLFVDEPEAPNDLERIVGAGRRARRRRQAALAVAGTAGAAGLAAAVVVPMSATGGHEASVSLGTKPSPTPSATPGKCYLIAAPPKAAKLSLQRLIRSGKVHGQPTVKTLHEQKDGRTLLEVCSAGASVPKSGDDTTQPPPGPPYHYTEDPQAIASRLGDHLHNRVTGFGLPITYTRPFAQESTKMEAGHPSYFDGNVDVHEVHGYGDIGVQVTHATTELVPFDGDCKAADDCVETKLTDGSVLRTSRVKAGKDDYLLTAEVHRSDGTVVQAQESNYPFGPDAGTQAHGDQPLTLDQLVSLAEDPDFSF